MGTSIRPNVKLVKLTSSFFTELENHIITALEINKESLMDNLKLMSTLEWITTYYRELLLNKPFTAKKQRIDYLISQNLDIPKTEELICEDVTNNAYHTSVRVRIGEKDVNTSEMQDLIYYKKLN